MYTSPTAASQKGSLARGGSSSSIKSQGDSGKLSLSTTTQEMDEKRRRRLERNRESARECRKRKKDKIMLLKQTISRLEADNLQLRLKLQIGPEAVKQQNDEATEHFQKLAQLISEVASESEIRKSLSDLQEKYADYGRDRRSGLEFHMKQLVRCLQPTQTTKTILWFIDGAKYFYARDGTVIPGAHYDRPDLSEVWWDLHKTLNPTIEQCRAVVELSAQPLPHQIAMLEAMTSAMSISNATASSLVPSSDDPDLMINRLSELLSEKNESLDQEMSEIQHILSASQIAKFLLWINKNTGVMQMLECLWPHVEEASSKAGS